MLCTLVMNGTYYHRFKALEGLDPISTKKSQPLNKFYFLQTHLRIHDQQSQTINFKSRKHMLHLHVTSILHNVFMHMYLPNLQYPWRQPQVRDTNLAYWIIILMVFFTSLSMCFAIFQFTSLSMCFAISWFTT